MSETSVFASKSSPSSGEPGPQTSRLISLDVLRGITIAFMILVNNGTPYSYWPLHHAHWNGWTPTDLVFPTFLFVMGTSLVFSFDSRLRRGASKASLFLQIVRRAAILFALGLVVNGFPFYPPGEAFHTLRIYGVLQRIAICFFLAGVLYLWDRRPTTIAMIVVVALVGYWVLVRWVPVPGLGMPGRDIPFMDQYANIVAYVDRHLFPGRLFERMRDPEGLLSNLPALGTTLLGMLTGLWLISKRTLSQKACGMFFSGLMGLLLGELWNYWFPINKNMWTSSYVLLAAGWTLIFFALCYWTVEIKAWKRGWTYFWLVFGMNAITAYVIAELLSDTLDAIQIHSSDGHGIPLEIFLYHSVFGWASPPALASLLYSLSYVLICFVPVVILYHKKIFLKV